MPSHQLSPLALEAQICFDLYSTSLAMTQVYKPYLEELNLTYTQYLIMLVLWQNDGLSLKEIANALFQKPGALTPVVKRMEGDGLLKRVRSKKDERYMQITLTEEGQRLKEKGLKVNQCMRENFAGDNQDLHTLSLQLKQLRAKLRSSLD